MITWENYHIFLKNRNKILKSFKNKKLQINKNNHKNKNNNKVLNFNFIRITCKSR